MNLIELKREAMSADEDERRRQGPSRAPEEADEVDRASRERMVFLARKYADRGFGPESAARLEILTERIRRLNPRVTEEAIAMVEQIASDLAIIETANRALQEELDKIERGE